jgi:Thioredoxin domain-containing protein
MIEFITVDDFKTKIFDFEANKEWSFTGKPTLLNFTASWCGPCKMFAPTLETLAEKYKGQIDILKIDIDQQPQLPAMFGIRSVPTTLFLVKGEEPILAGGVITEEQMVQAVEELLKLDNK